MVTEGSAAPYISDHISIQEAYSIGAGSGKDVLNEMWKKSAMQQRKQAIINRNFLESVATYIRDHITIQEAFPISVGSGEVILFEI